MSRTHLMAILLIGFLDYLGIALVYPVFTSMLFDQTYPLVAADTSSMQRGALLGILIGLAPFAQFFSAPLRGALSDTIGRKKTLIYGTLLGFGAYLLAVGGVYLHSLTVLCLYRFLIGISSATVPVAQAMIADSSTAENKGFRFSLFSASLGVGFTVGPFLGANLADASWVSWFGYEVPFAAAACMCLVSLLTIAGKFPETHFNRKQVAFNWMHSFYNIRKVFLWKQLQGLFLATFVFSFGWSFFSEFIPVLLKERFHFNLSDIGNYYAYGGAWYALSSSLIVVLVLKYFSAAEVVVQALLGCAVNMFLFMVVENRDMIWFITPLLMLALAFVYPAVAAMVSNRASVDTQGEVLGVYQSVIGGAMCLSPLLLGSAVGMFPGLVALGGGWIMLLAALIFWKSCRLVESQAKINRDSF